MDMEFVPLEGLMPFDSEFVTKTTKKKTIQNAKAIREQGRKMTAEEVLAEHLRAKREISMKSINQKRMQALNESLETEEQELMSAEDLVNPTKNDKFHKTIPLLENAIYHNKMPKARKYSKKRKQGATYYDKVTKQVTFRPNYLRRRDGVDEPATEKEWNATDFGLSYAMSTPTQKYKRMAHGYRGRGLYGGQGSFKDLGGMLGGALGSTFGYGKLGKMAGRAAGSGLARRFGMGLYGGQGLYESNQLMDVAGAAPSITYHGQDDETDDMPITCEEYIRPIYAPGIVAGSTSSFASETVDCNPGLQSFAPKLAAMAANYTHYEIKQLVFKIKSKVNESNVNNGISGDLMMTFNYDPANDSFDSVQDIMQTSGKTFGRIVDSLEMGVECDPRKSNDTKYLIRTTPVAIGRDVDEFDHGKLVIATNNIPANYSNVAIGDLYVSYTIILKQYRPGSSKLNNQQTDLFVSSTNTTETNIFNTSGTIDANILLAQQSNSGGGLRLSTIFVPLTTPPSTYGLAADRRIFYIFPAWFEGNCELIFRCEGALMTSAAMDVALQGNVTNVNDVYASGSAGDSPDTFAQATSATAHMLTYHIKVRSATSGIDNAIRLTRNTGTGSITQWTIEVREVTQNFWQARNLNTPKFLNYASGIEQSP